MHIMFIPSWYSNVRNKVHGSFFKEQASELQKAGVKVTVAYNEVWPLTMIGKIHEEKGLNYNIEDGLKTYRYKNYNYIPKNALMFKVFNKRMEKLYKEIVKKEGPIEDLKENGRKEMLRLTNPEEYDLLLEKEEKKQTQSKGKGFNR